MGMENKLKKFVTVGPFECIWREELRFKEPGRGCVAFEASAQNDVTLVFREQIGSQYYRYKMDNSPHYTVILGSHRNRRLKIEVNGETVVDKAGMGLCSSSSFRSYWISFYDGLITVGEGLNPFQNLLFQYLDPKRPHCRVQYIGLCSWDKHVGYRNITVLPLGNNNTILYKELEGGTSDGEEWTEDLKENKLTVVDFFENWDFSDMLFVVGSERKVVPAHRVILGIFGEFCFDLGCDSMVKLPSVPYIVMRSLLEFIYTGRTQIVGRQLGTLHELAKQFKVSSLTKKIDEIIEIDPKSVKEVEMISIGLNSNQFGGLGFPFEAPVDLAKLKGFLLTGESSDVNIYIEGYGLVARSHKLILSLWSPFFSKMFTNGMMESSSSEISLQDVFPEAFSLLIKFMYCGELEMNEMETSPLLLDLLLLSDQFGVTMLQRECCRRILECLSEDTVCPVLEAVSRVPSCKLLEETCKRLFAMHFDYCTTASSDFVSLDESTFREILQNPDMTVTSEEKVLDAILLWCMRGNDILGWASIDGLFDSSTMLELFGDRESALDYLLPFVRFPLMPPPLLNKLKNSRLSKEIPLLMNLVEEAIEFRSTGSTVMTIDQRFQYRRSSYKELQYLCDGDKNGVLYYAGTSYGEHQWVNPFLAKKITVLASSPASRYTDPKSLVSRAYQGTCFAGPRVENGRNSSWWMIDIGHDHQLICNYYTVRQDGSMNFMRHWAFQGSMDGENWTSLRVHENDPSICRPGQFASWAVNGPSALLPFRFFRVILTGPTTGDSNLWNLCICFAELYGYFR